MFLRTKPILQQHQNGASPGQCLPLSLSDSSITFRVPKEDAYINNSKAVVEFTFNGVFGGNAQQEQVLPYIDRLGNLCCLLKNLEKLETSIHRCSSRWQALIQSTGYAIPISIPSVLTFRWPPPILIPKSCLQAVLS